MHRLFFFFNDTATTEIYTLSLHDALPISFCASSPNWISPRSGSWRVATSMRQKRCWRARPRQHLRSEEHTSELQSHLNLVCRLLLEKKKKQHATFVAMTTSTCEALPTGVN